MRLVAYVLLGLVIVLVALRATAFLLYAYHRLPSPWETYHLEGYMTHLAWRAQHGVMLYPEWRDGPYLTNFYGPVYALIVGLVGRAKGASFEQLFVIGRGVTFAAVLVSPLLAASSLRTARGILAPTVCGLATLGVSPLFGFGVMVRPDLLADVLGFAGFILAVGKTRTTASLGTLLLILAVLTKQTSAIYLVSAAMALCLTHRRPRAAGVFFGASLALALICIVITLTWEPHYLAAMLGEVETPWSTVHWGRVLHHFLSSGPDLAVVSIIGLFLWTVGPARRPELVVLTITMGVVSLLTSAKVGSDQNYFLGLRFTAALAIGTLFGELAPAGQRPGAFLLFAALLAAVSLVPGTEYAFHQAENARRDSAFMKTTWGNQYDAAFQRVFRMAEDPELRLLTDSGIIDVHQGERTLFGDSYRFRLMVERGLIRPTKIETHLDQQVYDLIVTTHDLFAPDYANYEFGLPTVLVERARARYVSAGSSASLFYYIRKSGAAVAPGHS